MLAEAQLTVQPQRLETGVPGAVQPPLPYRQWPAPNTTYRLNYVQGPCTQPIPPRHPNQLVLALCAPQKQVSQVLSRVEHHCPVRAYLLKEEMGLSGPHTGLGVSAALTLVACITLMEKLKQDTQQRLGSCLLIIHFKWQVGVKASLARVIRGSGRGCPGPPTHSLSPAGGGLSSQIPGTMWTDIILTRPDGRTLTLASPDGLCQAQHRYV